MKTLRPLLGVLLGLTLSVQGFAVAATVPADLPEPAAVVASDADVPCHGDAVEPMTADPCDCCDGDCPNLATCAYAQLAVAPAAPLKLSPTPTTAIAANGWSLKTTAPTSRLRPPIPLHA